MFKKIFFTLAIFFSTISIIAQVQVSKEPRHKLVLENKYIRLLDVWLPPGDTTEFHVHSTPSLFLHLSNTYIATQVMEKEWINDQNIPGNAWYRSFSPDSMVHRVANRDRVSMHVTDIEILSAFDTIDIREPLPLPLIFENEKSFAYRLTDSTFNHGIIQNRGPMVIQLAAGRKVAFINARTNKSIPLLQGGYIYVEPNTQFYLNPSKGRIDLVLFEIR